MFKNRRAELKITVFGNLNQNNSIQRHVTEAYVEDVTSNVLNRFGVLTFTYDVRNFGSR